MPKFDNYLDVITIWNKNVKEGMDPSDSQRPLERAFEEWLANDGFADMKEQGAKAYLEGYSADELELLVYQLRYEIRSTRSLTSQEKAELTNMLSSALEG